MKEDKLLRVVGDIEDKYIEEAAPKRKSNKRVVRWLSIAASICIICMLGVIIYVMNDNRITDNEYKGNVEIGEKDEVRVPETGKLEDIDVIERKGFPYYIYNGDGKYKRIYEDLDISKNMSIEELVNKWLELNNISNTTIKEIQVEHIPLKEETVIIDGFEYVQATTAKNIYDIHFDGEELTEELFIGLINTVAEYRPKEKIGAPFINIYVNDKEIEISEAKNELGYTNIAIEVEMDEDSTSDNTNVGEKLPCDNPEYMVNVTFTVKDENGNPMKNIAYHLEFVAGEEGHYQPGQGLTDTTGTFTRKVHPNAEYILYLQKKNALVYADYQRYPEHKEIVYEEMAIRIKVEEGFTREIVWEKEEITVKEKPESQMLLDVSHIYEGPYEDVFLQLISGYGAQIQIGYLENNGTILWNDGYRGWYYLQLQKFEDTENGDSLLMNKSYRVFIEDGDITVDEDWDGEMIVLE